MNKYFSIKKVSKLKRILLGITIIVVVLYLIRKGGFLSSGSYPYAQEYEFDVPVKVLYDKIEEFKAEEFKVANMDYNPPGSMRFIDSFNRAGFSHIYLFYEEKNTLVHLIVFGNKKSFIWFDALNNLSDEFKWNRINDDFGRSENLANKREFCQRFLDKLNLHYKDNGNSAWVFWK